MTNAELPLETNDKETPKKKKIVHQVCDNNTQPFTQENMIERLYYYTQGFPVGTSTVHKALAKHGLPGNPAFVDTAAYKCLILGDDLIIYPSNVAMPSGRDLNTEAARAMVGRAIAQYKNISCSYDSIHSILEKHIARLRPKGDYPFRMLHGTRAKMLKEYFDYIPMGYKTIILDSRNTKLIKKVLSFGGKNMVMLPWSNLFHSDAHVLIDDQQYAMFEWTPINDYKMEVKVLVRSHIIEPKTPKLITAFELVKLYGYLPVGYKVENVESDNDYNIHPASNSAMTIVYPKGTNYLELLREQIAKLCMTQLSFPVEHFLHEVTFMNAEKQHHTGASMRFAFTVLSTLYPELVYYDENSDTVDFMPF